jgi:hypothetical protein
VKADAFSLILDPPDDCISPDSDPMSRRHASQKDRRPPIDRLLLPRCIPIHYQHGRPSGISAADIDYSDLSPDDPSEPCC